MSGPEILDRSAVEVLLDDCGTDVARARDRRRIPEAFADRPHDGGNTSFRLGVGLGKSALGKADRRREGAAPRPEILRRELLAHVDADVVVQPLAGEVVQVALPLVAEE